MNQVSNQSTLLIPAVKENNKKTVQLLLKNKVDVNITDSHGKSALHYAIENNNSEIVKALLDSKADIYLKDSTNKIAADHVIESNDKDQIIVELITGKILEDSIAILKDCKKSEEVSETPKKSEAEEESATKESPEENKRAEEKVSKTKNEIEFIDAEIVEFPEEYNHAEKNAYKKIKALLKRLEDPKPSEYKAANTFLLFLEIFCCDTSSEISKKIQYLKDTLLKKNSITPEIIINVIEYCSPEFNSDLTYHELVGKKVQFFIKLAEFLKSLNGNENLFGISTFFNYENVQQINRIICSDEIDPEEVDNGFKNKLNSLIGRVYYSAGQNFGRDICWEQQWFEFNVNIYPYFIREVNKENEDLMEKEMSQLRDNFVRSFEPVLKKNWVQSFREFIIKLKGKLLEYFYAKKLHKRFSISSPWYEDYNRINENINKDFESIRGAIVRVGLCKDYFSSKFEKSLFPTLLSGDVDLRLIRNCFYFISIIEFLNENVRGKISYYCNNFDGTEKIHGSKLLDDRSRRCFLEQYINVKMYKQKEYKVNYIMKKESLINGLSEYGVDKECVESIFELYQCKKIRSAVSLVAKDVCQFMRDLMGVNKLCTKAKEIDIVRFVECIFKDTTDLDLSQVPKVFTTIPSMISNIREQYVAKFTRVNIAGIEVDVKATIITMFKTFYNAFDEYRTVNNVGDLFKRETFLNTLLSKQKSLIIDPHLSIDYMSPFIVKIILRLKNNKKDQVKALVSEDLMKKLIQYLAKEGCLNYLSNLLAVQFDKLDPYDLLLDFIEKKEINLEHIHQIFDNFDHIQGYAQALKSKTLVVDKSSLHPDNSLNLTIRKTIYDSHINRAIIPFLKLINLKAKEHFIRTNSYYMSNNDLQRSVEEYNKAREILSISEKIGEQFSNEILTACHVHCIDRDLLNAMISEAKKNLKESLNFFNAAQTKLDQCTISEHSEIHDKYKLLISLIRFYILKTKMTYDSMEIKHEDNNLDESTFVTSFKNLYNLIVSKLCNKRAGFENIIHTYQELMNDEIYKNLLTTSELLCSEKYFNINNILLSMAFFIWRKYRAGPRTCSDHTELQNALDILEKYVYIYRFTSTDFLKHIATIYKQISLDRLSNHETQLVYCLKALIRFIMYYNIQKETPAIFSRSDIEKNILDLLHEYIFKQFQNTKGMDLNYIISRLRMLAKVYNLCTQVLTSINDWPTNKKLQKHYLQILEISADVCQDCGHCYKQQGRPEWTKYYREAVEYSKSMIKLHELVGNPNEKCCENSIKLIENMESTLQYFALAESCFQAIIAQSNNPPLLCCRSENTVKLAKDYK